GSNAGGAFIWENGVMTALPSLPGLPGTSSSVASAINDAGVVVGNCGEPRALIWLDRAVYDLATLVSSGGTNWTLSAANDASNAGYIVGTGTSPNDHQQHGFLLTPL